MRRNSPYLEVHKIQRKFPCSDYPVKNPRCIDNAKSGAAKNGSNFHDDKVLKAIPKMLLECMISNSLILQNKSKESQLASLINYTYTKWACMLHQNFQRFCSLFFRKCESSPLAISQTARAKVGNWVEFWRDFLSMSEPSRLLLQVETFMLTHYADPSSASALILTPLPRLKQIFPPWKQSIKNLHPLYLSFVTFDARPSAWGFIRVIPLVESTMRVCIKALAEIEEDGTC